MFRPLYICGLPGAEYQVTFMQNGLNLNAHNTLEQSGQELFTVANKKVNFLGVIGLGQFDQEADVDRVELAFDDELGGQETVKCAEYELAYENVVRHTFSLSLAVQQICFNFEIKKY